MQIGHAPVQSKQRLSQMTGYLTILSVFYLRVTVSMCLDRLSTPKVFCLNTAVYAKKGVIKKRIFLPRNAPFTVKS